MKKRILNIVKYLFFLSIGALLIFIILKDLNFYSIIGHFKKANYFWAILAIPIGILSHIFRSLRWNMLIKELGHKTDIKTTFYAVMVGYLANTAVPRLGEITRCGVLSKKKSISFDSLLGTVIAERIFDTLCLIVIIFATIIFQISLLGDFAKQNIIKPLTNKFSANNLILVSIITVLILGISIFFISQFFKKHNENKWIIKIKASILGLKQGFATIIKQKNKTIFFLHTLVIWSLYVLMVYVCFFALKETSHLNFVDALTIMALGSIGIVAPVPGGIGTYHAVVIFVMTKVFVISVEPATTFAFIAHTSQLVMILLVGTFAFLMIFKSTSKNNQQK